MDTDPDFLLSTDEREGSTVLPAIELTQGESSQKYNIQLDFMKHHMSGMLIVRRMPDNEIRIVASTYFGLSLFDFLYATISLLSTVALNP